MRFLALLLALPPWNEPTTANRLEGLSTFYADGIMEQVADYRGYDGPREPVALMACGDLGRNVVVVIDGHWVLGHVVDCARRDHYADRVAEGKVVELSRSLWQRLGLPDRPVPAVVWFDVQPPVEWH